jgi:hypothetical protein
MRAGTYSRWFRDDVKDEEVAVVERLRLDHLAAKRCSKAEMRRRPARQFSPLAARCRCTCSNSGRAGHTSLATTQKFIQGDTAAKRNAMKVI